MKRRKGADITEILNSLEISPRVLLDVGVGQWPHNEAEQFKQRYPDISIVGLEPQLGVFMQRLHGFPGKMIPAGAWSSPDILPLRLTADLGNTSVFESLPSHCVTETGVQWASFITIDALVEKLGLEKPIFLWADIEGAELEMLKGAVETLSSRLFSGVYLEVSKKPRRHGEPLREDVVAEMGVFGYVENGVFEENDQFENVLFERSN